MANVFSHFVTWFLIFFLKKFKKWFSITVVPLSPHCSPLFCTSWPHSHNQSPNSTFWRAHGFNFSFMTSAFYTLLNLCLGQVYYFIIFAFLYAILNSIDLYSSSLIFLLLFLICLKFKYQVSKTFCFSALSTTVYAAKGSGSFNNKLNCGRIWLQQLLKHSESKFRFSFQEDPGPKHSNTAVTVIRKRTKEIRHWV